MSIDVRAWIDSVTGRGWYWYAKRLSGNDTLLNKSHQAGLYIPRQVAARLFPSLKEGDKNPRVQFGAAIDSHNMEAMPKAIWYNNKLFGGTRNECRITNWGGKGSPILDPDATGSLCVFAFEKEGPKDAAICCVWLCSTIEEEDAIEDRIGVVDPGLGVFYDASGQSPHPIAAAEKKSDCWLQPEEILQDWRLNFPEAASIVALSVERTPALSKRPPDQRLLRRRDCEYAIFRSIEEAVSLPRIKENFATVDLFVDYANKVTNRRKSRAGRSLELHATTIFNEEGLAHSHNQISEGSKRPDFLFPSVEAYHDGSFPADKLRMLAAKTTCKDRWRQILNEASRIPEKFLLTLQEGISPAQFNEMREASVRLVVPKSLHAAYSPKIRPELLTLDAFIRQTKKQCG